MTPEQLFNLKELTKPWEDSFYEGDWDVSDESTPVLTPTEQKIMGELGNFLPRHMPYYDWNRPYAEEIILIVRRHVAESLLPNENKKHD